MKKTVKENIKEMKSLVKNMPKSINESLNFEAADDMENYDEEMPEEEPMVDEPEMEEEPSQMDASAHAAQLIDDIRKKALRAMADLADTPEDENYIMLKKVWQMTDRKPEQQQNNQSLSTTVQKAVNESILDLISPARRKRKEREERAKKEAERQEKERKEREEKRAAWDKESRERINKEWEDYKKEVERKIQGGSNFGSGSSDPFDSRVGGWKDDGLYHCMGGKHTDDLDKDWMYGTRG